MMRMEAGNEYRSDFMDGGSLQMKFQKQKELFSILEKYMDSPVEVMTIISDLLKTPLEGIQKQGLVEVLDEVSFHLKEVVNNILDFEALEFERYPVVSRKMELRQNLQQWLSNLETTASSKGLHFDFQVSSSVPDEVYGDPEILKKVMVNLVSNAIKFTERGEVLAGLEMRTQQESEVFLEGWIRDTGKGVEGDQLEWIFEPFSQKQTDPLEYNGPGLGLAVTKRFMKLLNGHIEVKSEPGQGTEFRFWFPVG